MFLLHLLRLCLFGRRPAVILCGHIDLVPVCLLLKWRFRAPVVLFLHGIEAWTPSGGARRKRLEGIDMVVAVSAVTRDRFARCAARSPISVMWSSATAMTGRRWRRARRRWA